MEEYSYRRLNKNDIPQLENLFLSAFGQSVKGNFFKWKYFENPFGDALLIGVFFQDVLVGSGAMIPEKMSNSGKIISVYKCTDLMTHPNHQKRGLSKSVNKLLAQEVEIENCSFSYTLCSKVSTKSFLKTNWLFVGEILNFFKPRILLNLTSVFVRSRNSGIKYYREIAGLLDRYNFSNSSEGMALQKTVEFVKWRTSNPNFTYSILCHYNAENEINGYLIFSISSNNLANLIDIDSSDKTVLKGLFREFEKVVLKNKYKGILVMCLKNSSLSRYASKRGYIYNPFKKGPLKTILDFNIKNALVDPPSPKTKAYDITALNYDDI